MEDKDKNKSITPPIRREEDLPPGRLISYIGDEVELTERARKEFILWEVASQGDKKQAAIYSVRDAFKTNNFLQTIKNAEQKGFKIYRQGIIEQNVLNAIYDKRAQLEVQRANGDNSVVVKTFELILMDALIESVSDIHIEVRETGGGIIKMRKDGELLEYNSDKRMTFAEAQSLCSVIYNVLASTKSVSFDPRVFQQAAVSYNIDGQDLKLRFQSLPTADGFDVVLRVLPIGRSEEFTPLQDLGYTEQQMLELINITSRPVGALIIAGITGSGKSTTLKNLLMFINANSGYRYKIYTIEDPPEYNIAKVSQIPVIPPKEGEALPAGYSPFAMPIKACMRADPDVIMIGEVRDHLTGDLMKKAIQSGHQVLTTVHTTSALGIISRFQDFGLTKSELGSPEFLSGLLYQKLMPKVCTHCGVSLKEHLRSPKATQKDADLYARMSSVCNPDDYDIKLRREGGCEHCQGRGILGRTVVAEVIMLDLRMIQLIEKGQIIPLMLYWRSLSDKRPASENMRGKTCMEHGFQKVLSGIVSPYDLESSFKPIDEMILKEEDILIHDESGHVEKNSASKKVEANTPVKAPQSISTGGFTAV